jgi:ABC-type multidrug transport system fused ATPase/permease subunit
MAIIQVVQMKLPVLTVTLICVVPLIFLGSWLSGKITFKNRNKIQAKIASLTAKLAEKIDNVEVIKAPITTKKKKSPPGMRLSKSWIRSKSKARWWIRSTPSSRT